MPTVRLTGIVFVVAILSGCGIRSAERPPTPEEIESLEHQMWEDYANGRYGALRERMLPDAVLLGPAGIRDRADAVAGMEREACRLDSFSLDEVRVTILAPNVAVITYRSRDNGTCGGQQMGGSDVHSSTWIKRDGKWMTAVHHENPLTGATGFP